MFEIGSTLRQARERRSIGLDQIEAETKIRARYLRALEEEDFDILPGPTFIRGFLRTYAAYLGLDGQLFVDEYNSRYFDPIRDEDAFHRRRIRNAQRDKQRRRTSSNAVLVALAAIVAVAVLVVIAATYPNDHPSAASQPPPNAPTTSAPVVNPSLNVNPSSSGVTTSSSTVSSAPVTIEAVASSPCWVQITEGYGYEKPKVVFNDLVDPNSGRVKTPKFTSSRGFRVDVGAEGAVKLVVNGQPRVITTGTHFLVSPGGSVELIPGA
jgi:cytoskeleton protein RodZ